MKAAGHSTVQMRKRYLDLQAADVANACGTCQIDQRIDKQVRVGRHEVIEIIVGGVGERLKPPVLKTGVHSVDREFESRPLRQIYPKITG